MKIMEINRAYNRHAMQEKGLILMDPAKLVQIIKYFIKTNYNVLHLIALNDRASLKKVYVLTVRIIREVRIMAKNVEQMYVNQEKDYFNLASVNLVPTFNY